MINVTQTVRGLPGGPMVKRLTPNAGEAVSMAGLKTKIPHAMGQRSLQAAITDAHMLQQKASTEKNKKYTKGTTKTQFFLKEQDHKGP